MAARNRPNPKHPLRDRIFQHVHLALSGCWEWAGSRQPKGYGTVRGDNGKTALAHRAMYELLREPIPPELEIDHLCRNRSCVNPDHLEVVTPYENFIRGESPLAQKRRQISCINGHSFDEKNTISYIRKGATREARHCRICMRTYIKNWKKRYREARRIAG